MKSDKHFNPKDSCEQEMYQSIPFLPTNLFSPRQLLKFPRPL